MDAKGRPDLRELSVAFKVAQTKGEDDLDMKEALRLHAIVKQRLTGKSKKVPLPPKQAARIARFTHAKDLVQRGAQPSDVAAMVGYSDQPHLSREWKSMTGWTLRQSKEDFPLLQDTDMLPA